MNPKEFEKTIIETILEKTPMYALTLKVKNKKYILATWNGGGGTCLALAQDVFEHHGLAKALKIGKVDWTANVIQEKMFAGYSSDCLHLTDTLEQANSYEPIESDLTKILRQRLQEKATSSETVESAETVSYAKKLQEKALCTVA
jgi:hypothetical protein